MGDDSDTTNRYKLFSTFIVTNSLFHFYKPKLNHNIKTIDGTLSLYSFFTEKGNRTTSEGGFKLETQKYACFCKVCMQEIFGLCQFQSDIDPMACTVLKNNSTSDVIFPTITRELIQKHDGNDFSNIQLI